MCLRTQAFGVTPGVKAVVRVPEIPDRSFAGTVTRLSDALRRVPAPC